jgi:hypothetical protein
MVIDDDSQYHPHTSLALLESIERVGQPVCFVCEEWSWCMYIFSLFFSDMYSMLTIGHI